MFAGVFKKKSITLIMKRLRGSSLINPFFNEASSFVKRKRFMCKATDIRFWIENVKTNTIRSSRETVRYFCSFFFWLDQRLASREAVEWGISSVGRAHLLQRWSHQFKSDILQRNSLFFQEVREVASQVLQ